jgi:hypothetical protein
MPNQDRDLEDQRRRTRRIKEALEEAEARLLLQGSPPSAPPLTSLSPTTRPLREALRSLRSATLDRQELRRQLELIQVRGVWGRGGGGEGDGWREQSKCEESVCVEGTLTPSEVQRMI